MKIVPLIPIICSVASCYPLPSPTYSISRYGLDATLVDATNGKPLQQKDVSLIIDNSRFEQRTADDGRVRVSARKDHYWTWLGGPAQASAPRANIVIGAEGFKPARIEWSMLGGSHASVQGGRIQVGNVIMEKR